MSRVESLRTWAKRLKRDALTLWFCARHPDTPLAAKLLAMALAAYAFSPIDLIPDFIPVLGFLDEVILLPLGIALCIKLVPKLVMDQCRRSASDWMARQHAKPRSYVAAAMVIALWGLTLWACWLWFGML